MDVFDTFDGSKPNLISSRTLKDIETKLNVPDNVDNSSKVLNGIGNFYNEYIVPNFFPIIVISLFIIYLIIRYILKRDREERDIREEEEEEKRDRVNRHIIKNDPEDENFENNSKTGKRTHSDKNGKNNNDKNVDTHIDDQVDLSDIISDDYLLTDDDEDEDYNEQEYNDNIMRQVMERGSPYDIEKATSIIFAQD